MQEQSWKNLRKAFNGFLLHLREEKPRSQGSTLPKVTELVSCKIGTEIQDGKLIQSFSQEILST